MLWGRKSLPDNHHLVFVVRMVRVSRVEKVELGIVDLVLQTTLIEI